MKGYEVLFLIAVIVCIRLFVSCYVDNLCENDIAARESDNGVRARILNRVTMETRKYLPSPHSELVLGMVFGIDDFSLVPRFKKALKDTGTIHVVVVSGFNITLVFGLVLSVLGSQYKFSNLVLAQIITLGYSILAGFDPPVVRAWLMGSLVSWGKYYGRSIDTTSLLIFVGLIMLGISPKLLFSLSFQLSFLATLGLVILESPISKVLLKLFKSKGVLLSDLSATLSAQIFVTPLLAYHFGTISVISPLVNMLVLWTVPIATVLGGLFIALVVIIKPLAYLVLLILYPLLDMFVELVMFFNTFTFSAVSLKLSIGFVILYYVILGIVVFKKGDIV